MPQNLQLPLDISLSLCHTTILIFIYYSSMKQFDSWEDQKWKELLWLAIKVRLFSGNALGVQGSAELCYTVSVAGLES